MVTVYVLLKYYSFEIKPIQGINKYHDVLFQVVTYKKTKPGKIHSRVSINTKTKNLFYFLKHYYVATDLLFFQGIKLHSFYHMVFS